MSELDIYDDTTKYKVPHPTTGRPPLQNNNFLPNLKRNSSLGGLSSNGSRVSSVSRIESSSHRGGKFSL